MHPTRTLAILTCSGAVLAASLAGCGSSTTAQTSSSTGTSTSTGTMSAPQSSGTPASSTSPVVPRGLPAGYGSQAADGVFPRTIKHYEGTTVLKSAPRRIVVISTGQADALLTLGITPVGSTAGDGATEIPQYLKDAFPAQKAALDAVVSVGKRTAPSIEAIAKLKPDLILTNKAGKDGDQLYRSLSAIAPTVVTRGTGLYWKGDFLLTADAVGKRQAAQSWLDTYQKDAAAAGATVQGKPTVSFLRRNGNRIRIFDVASFSGSVAEDMGLARPASESATDKTSTDLSTEQLDQADADWLFYGVQGGQASALTGLPMWSTLKAVQNKHAVQVDDDTF